MEYVSPNIEVNLFSEDGTVMHKFYPSKKYAAVGYDGDTIFVKTKEHSDIRFCYSTTNHRGWSNATTSACEVG